MFAGYYEKNFVLQPIENIHEKASRIKYHPVIFLRINHYAFGG